MMGLMPVLIALKFLLIDEPDDAAQDADVDDGSFSPGGSLDGEVPDLNNEWGWFLFGEVVPCVKKLILTL